MSRFVYSLGWWLATPVVVAYLLWRARRQPDYLCNWRERWGLVSARNDDAPLVWVHAVSVGETRAAQSLIAALLAADPSLRILLTHMTPTGRETGRELLVARHSGRVVQAFLPYDYGFAARRFLRAWRPSLGVLMETELWPNLCAAARRESVPLALVNARLSERSLRRGLRWASLITPALRSLACVVAQTDADAQRLARLGRDDAIVGGNLKFDVEVPESQCARGRAWREALDGRPVVLAASTRDGEEALLLDAWRRAAPMHPTPLLVIVPRHPQRFDEVARMVVERGFSLARRSGFEGEDLPEAVARGTDVLLGDSMGEMFAWYATADAAIMGGSLLPFGSQNLIEACAVGTPVILGPSTYNFADAAEQAVKAGAAVTVDDADGAVSAALKLARRPDERSAASLAALGFSQAHRGATARTMRCLSVWLPFVNRPRPRQRRA